MKQFSILIISIVSLFTQGGSSIADFSEPAASPVSYKLVFGEDYYRAEILAGNFQQSVLFMQHGIDPNFAFSIVFPELIRFNSLSNKIELISLFTLYAKFGEKYSDFSVGPFQMKPSFATQIEKDYLKFKKNLAINEKFAFDTLNTSNARKERISRLNDNSWQAKYLVLFIKIMDLKSKEAKFESREDKLRIFATAYNFGYTKSLSEIQKASKQKHFHLSVISSEKLQKYSYANISEEYYLSRFITIRNKQNMSDKRRVLFVLV